MHRIRARPFKTALDDEHVQHRTVNTHIFCFIENVSVSFFVLLTLGR